MVNYNKWVEFNDKNDSPLYLTRNQSIFAKEILNNDKIIKQLSQLGDYSDVFLSIYKFIRNNRDNMHYNIDELNILKDFILKMISVCTINLSEIKDKDKDKNVNNLILKFITSNLKNINILNPKLEDIPSLKNLILKLDTLYKDTKDNPIQNIYKELILTEIKNPL